MAQQCFRNTELENLHAERVPDSITGDYTDVKVVTPHGEIAWSELSRLNNKEMKILMIEVVNKTYTFLSMLFGSGPKNTRSYSGSLTEAGRGAAVERSRIINL